MKKINFYLQFECQYEAALIDSDQKKIGVLDILVHLEDHGPYYRTNKKLSRENLGPPILDDSLAYKIVEELETWKERQKEIFRIEVKFSSFIFNFQFHVNNFLPQINIKLLIKHNFS